MADVKISALPPTTTPAASDVVPIVSGGATDKVTIQNLVNAALAAGVTGSTAAGTALVRIEQTGNGYAILIEDTTTPDATPFCIHASGGASLGNTTDPGASSLYCTGNIAGAIITATTALTGAVVKATNSAGLTFQNASGTAQMQMGSGGGSNISLEVPTNINPANGDVSISPTGTGKVTIAPAQAGSINNMALGTVTPLAVNATALTASSSLVTNGAAVEFKGLTGGKTVSIAGAGGTGDPILTISVNDAADATLLVPSVLGSTNSGTLIIDVGDASVSSWTFSGGDLFPSQGAKNMTNGFAFIPGAADAPVGTPVNTNAGVFPMYINSTSGSEKLYVYVNGAWKSTSLT